MVVVSLFFHSPNISAASPGVQYMVKAVSKGYLVEQGLQEKVIQDWGSLPFHSMNATCSEC